jgi:hypothetical protein
MDTHGKSETKKKGRNNYIVELQPTCGSIIADAVLPAKQLYFLYLVPCRILQQGPTV